MGGKMGCFELPQMNRGGRMTLAGSVFCYDYLTFLKSTLRLLSQYIDCSIFPITS